jgi:hypothetical protein
MTGIERYEFVEIDTSDKAALQQAAKDGYRQYGVSRDLRSDHTSYVKLRRAVGKEKTR